MPNTLNGTVYIRVRDTDRTASHTSLDTVYVDHMYIHSENCTRLHRLSHLPVWVQLHYPRVVLTLSWTDNSADELGFELQRSTDQSNWTGLPGLAADIENVSDTGLLSSTTYYYRVRAFNLSGSSAWDGIASATTDAGPPPADISLSLVGSKNRGKHVIDLIWSGITTSSVDIYRDGGLLTTVSDTDSYTDNTNNKGGITYTYQVCEAGTDHCSAIESITF